MILSDLLLSDVVGVLPFQEPSLTVDMFHYALCFEFDCPQRAKKGGAGFSGKAAYSHRKPSPLLILLLHDDPP